MRRRQPPAPQPSHATSRPSFRLATTTKHPPKQHPQEPPPQTLYSATAVRAPHPDHSFIRPFIPASPRGSRWLIAHSLSAHASSSTSASASALSLPGAASRSTPSPTSRRSCARNQPPRPKTRNVAQANRTHRSRPRSLRIDLSSCSIHSPHPARYLARLVTSLDSTRLGGQWAIAATAASTVVYLQQLLVFSVFLFTPGTAATIRFTTLNPSRKEIKGRASNRSTHDFPLQLSTAHGRRKQPSFLRRHHRHPTCALLLLNLHGASQAAVRSE